MPVMNKSVKHVLSIYECHTRVINLPFHVLQSAQPISSSVTTSCVFHRASSVMGRTIVETTRMKSTAHQVGIVNSCHFAIFLSFAGFACSCNMAKLFF